MSSPDLIEALAPVVDELERLGVAYYVGGSVASSAYGHMRTTQDVDLVADLRPEHVAPLVEALEDAYYVSPAAISEAIARTSCFNLIHLGLAFKIDIFVVKQRAYDRTALRRIREKLFDEDHAFFVAAAEDIILAKLQWYRHGDEVSEVQWRDVVRVLDAQRLHLDRGYLEKWAAELSVDDLLKKASREADAKDL